MAKVLVTFHSRTGHTQAMAEAVAEGARQPGGARVDVKPLAGLSPEELLHYDGIIIGSPTSYGTMAAEVKQLFDRSISIHGQLAGKVGGAFADSGNVGGGNETTVLDILKAMLVHGMIIPGNAAGDHYGPVAIGQPDARALKECLTLGATVARLAAKLHG